MASQANLLQRSLLIGRVLPKFHSKISTPTQPRSSLERPTPKDARVIRVPVMQFSAFLKRYFREEHDLLAHDPDHACREGDTVLLRRAEAPPQQGVIFQVERVLFQLGDTVDPLTRQHVVGHEYDEQMNRVYKAYGRKDDHTGFRYDKAPPRGWQEGKRDFTEKVTYHRWHVFNNKDDYSLV